MIEALLRTPAADLHYLQDGEGPDLFWIPGGDHPASIYHAQFAHFRNEYRCTSPDLRGVGRTVPHSEPPWAITDFAADCVALIEAVCQPPVVVVGLSLGALIVQELALSRPELLRVAIAMGTSGRKSGFIEEWEEAEIARARSGVALPAEFSIVHYAALSYPAEVLGDDALWARCRPYLAGPMTGRDPAMLAAQWQACVEYSALDRLPECTLPLHVVAFSQDLQTPPARGRQVADAAGNGHFHLLKGLGHCSMFGHRPEDVHRCIRAILASEGVAPPRG